MLDPGSHFRLGAGIGALDQVNHAAVAIAAVGEVPGLGSVLPDHRALAAIGLVAPHPGLSAMQQLRPHPVETSNNRAS